MLAIVMVVAAAGALVLGKDRVARLADRMAGWPPAVVRLPIAIGLAPCAFMLWSISSAIGEFRAGSRLPFRRSRGVQVIRRASRPW